MADFSLKAAWVPSGSRRVPPPRMSGYSSKCNSSTRSCSINVWTSWWLPTVTIVLPGAAFSNDIAWLIGAAFAPLVALGLCANFGLAYVGAYLLSGALATLAALGVNRWLRLKRETAK